jgi:hypothetical protein
MTGRQHVDLRTPGRVRSEQAMHQDDRRTVPDVDVTQVVAAQDQRRQLVAGHCNSPLASIHRLTWCYRGVGMKKVPSELG